MIDHRTEEYIQKGLALLERIAKSLEASHEAKQLPPETLRNYKRAVHAVAKDVGREMLDMRKTSEEPSFGS
jgi:hypothetical protein